MSEFKVYMATAEDTELLVRQRIEMWIDIRPELRKKAQETQDVTRSWIKKKIDAGKLIGFIAKTEAGQVAGSGCIWLREDAPRLSTTLLESPYLISMYTEERFRNAGVARMIVQHAINWCRDNGYNTIGLHASEKGAPLYESFGFKPTTEMRLML